MPPTRSAAASNKAKVATPAAFATSTRSSARRGAASGAAANKAAAAGSSCRGAMGTPGASPRHRHHQQPAQRLQQEPLPLFAQMMAQTVRSQGEICCQGMSQIHHDARAARSEMMQSFQVLRDYIANFQPAGTTAAAPRAGAGHRGANQELADTPLDEATVRWVLSLKVSELQAELVRRGKDRPSVKKTTRKIDLQHLLRAVLEKERGALLLDEQQRTEPPSETKRTAREAGDDDPVDDPEESSAKKTPHDENLRNSAAFAAAAAAVEMGPKADDRSAAQPSPVTKDASPAKPAAAVRSPLSTLVAGMAGSATKHAAALATLKSPPKVSDMTASSVAKSDRRRYSNELEEVLEDDDDSVSMSEGDKEDEGVRLDLGVLAEDPPAPAPLRKSSSSKPATEIVARASYASVSSLVKAPLAEDLSEAMEIVEPEPSSSSLMEVDSSRKRSRSRSPKPTMDGSHVARSSSTDKQEKESRASRGSGIDSSMIDRVQSTLNNLSFDKSPIRKQAKTLHGKSPTSGTAAAVNKEVRPDGAATSVPPMEVAVMSDSRVPEPMDADPPLPEPKEPEPASTEQVAEASKAAASQTSASVPTYAKQYVFTGNKGKSQSSPSVLPILTKHLSAPKQQQQQYGIAAAIAGSSSNKATTGGAGGGLGPSSSSASSSAFVKPATATGYPYGQSFSSSSSGRLIDRMRSKANPGHSLATASAPVSTAASSSSYQRSAAGMTDYDKRQALTMKVREKALGGDGRTGGFDFAPATGSVSSKSYAALSTVPTLKAPPPSSFPSLSLSRPEMASTMPKARPPVGPAKPPQAAMTGKSVAASPFASSPASTKTWKPKSAVESFASSPAPKKVLLPPQFPSESYEMTDSEDEDSDDDSYERQKKKPHPEWTKPANLAAILHYQYTSGDPKVDPDNVFGDFAAQSCDLAEMFGVNKERYKRRGSSGNWTKDRLTEREKMEFKRSQMGAARRY